MNLDLVLYKIVRVWICCGRNCTRFGHSCSVRLS